MMKYIVITLMLLLSISVFSQSSYDWSKLIDAIAMVESANNPKAIGKGGSVGLLQITPIVVKECNNILKKQKYTLQDRLDAEKSKEMFILIQSKYNPTNDIEKAIRLWNGGPKYSIKKTQLYYNKVMKWYQQLLFL